MIDGIVANKISTSFEVAIILGKVANIGMNLAIIVPKVAIKNQKTKNQPRQLKA